MAKVTIATSVYNKGPWLERCLNSFANQTFKDIEIVVVDNASTDKSAQIVEEFCKRDKRFRVITLEDNIGPGGGYETAINNINTEYFALCDSDDYIEPNYIEVLYKKLIDNNADMSMCTNDMVWDDGTTKINNRPGKDVIFTDEDIPNILPQLLDHHSNNYLGFYLAELGVLWGKLYKTSLVVDNNINYSKDDWLWCDWLFNFKVYKHIRKMVYTEDTQYHFYQSEGSVTRTFGMNWKKLDQIELILNKFYIETIGLKNQKLNVAINKFFYINACSLFRMYVLNFPNITSNDDIYRLCERISNWNVFKKNTLFYHPGLSLKNTIKTLMMRHKIFIPNLITHEKKRELSK